MTVICILIEVVTYWFLLFRKQAVKLHGAPKNVKRHSSRSVVLLSEFSLSPWYVTHMKNGGKFPRKWHDKK